MGDGDYLQGAGAFEECSTVSYRPGHEAFIDRWEQYTADDTPTHKFTDEENCLEQEKINAKVEQFHRMATELNEFEQRGQDSPRLPEPASEQPSPSSGGRGGVGPGRRSVLDKVLSGIKRSGEELQEGGYYLALVDRILATPDLLPYLPLPAALLCSQYHYWPGLVRVCERCLDRAYSSSSESYSADGIAVGNLGAAGDLGSAGGSWVESGGWGMEPAELLEFLRLATLGAAKSGCIPILTLALFTMHRLDRLCEGDPQGRVMATLRRLSGWRPVGNGSNLPNGQASFLGDGVASSRQARQARQGLQSPLLESIVLEALAYTRATPESFAGAVVDAVGALLGLQIIARTPQLMEDLDSAFFGRQIRRVVSDPEVVRCRCPFSSFAILIVLLSWLYYSIF